MFTSLKIQNYRCLKELEVDNLSRINLIAGTNNSGKTSLLEALSLLSGGGNVGLMSNVHINRSMDPPPSPENPFSTKKFWETLLKPFFNEFDVERSIVISGYWNSKQLSLEIAHQLPKSSEFSFNRDSKGKLEDTFVDDHLITLSFTDPSGSEPHKSWLRISNQGLHGEKHNLAPPFNSLILPIQHVENIQMATLLGLLRKQKKASLLVDALRIIEPKIDGIEENSSYGQQPTILCDIKGYSELVPLSIMGEGILRLMRLILAIASAPKGVVLVDEIETGFHHSVLPKIWKVIAETARIFDVQVFATTHSYGCIMSARESIEDDLSLHRIDTDEKGNRHVHYSSEAIESAIKFNMEVR